MKILINTSNLYVGGGLQVALSFINELKEIQQEYYYHILMSKAVDLQLNQSNFPANFYFYLIEKSPSSLSSRSKVVSELNTLENKIDPDIVFSVFGPSYWKPKAKHIIGFADGWVYNPKSVAYDRLPLIKRIKMRLVTKYKAYYLKNDGDYFVLETEDAKKKLSDVVGINRDNIFVVGNTYSSIFNNEEYLETSNKNYITLPEKENNEFRLMYIAHNHPSKNLEVINNILPLIENLNVKFVLTIDDESYKQIFSNSKNIINLGAISQKSCPSIYVQCDALFAPTLLETFSAAYPEAMKMEKPILTSNCSFATDVCQDAALYFNPLDPEDIASKIKELIDNKTLQYELIEKGKERVKKFETARSRAEKYVTLCINLVNYDK